MSKKLFTEFEVVTLVKKILKEDFESLTKQIAEKYTNLAKEQASNEITNANAYIKQTYPENGSVSIVLKDGELSLPFMSNSSITFNLIKGEETKKLFYTVDDVSNLDIADLMKIIKDYEYCEVTTYTPKEVEIFDEELFEKEGKVLSVKKTYTKSFYGIYRCSDVIGLYKTFGKFE